uniref:DDE Tnp4 domain-containing protein n=1 Tax=Trichogramma kaykai TaxID=54128 RepID=A0ABD2WYP2_9HYME
MHNEEEFYSFTNITIHQFNVLRDMLGPYLEKSSNRPSLPSVLRFAAVLNNLAKADSAHKNALFYSIGQSTLYAIVPEVCDILSTVLGQRYLRKPSLEDFKRVAEELTGLDFPHWVGLLDGKHCSIRKPMHSGSAYYNYKKFHSIVLLAITNIHKRSLIVNLGGYGSLNDAFTFNNSDICAGLEKSEVSIPPPELLPGSEALVPYYLIGDGGFPVKQYLMKPYTRVNNMMPNMEIFNLRLSHVRQTVECAFRSPTKFWVVHQKELCWKLSTSEQIIMSTICLQNYKITIGSREERGFVNH